jgi:atypical dual specificity phosphatase
MTEIIPGLFVGTRLDAHRGKDTYTYIVNMASEVEAVRLHALSNFDLDDSDESSDITPFLDDATAVIHANVSRPDATVLVHCLIGVNRSVSTVVAYLAAYHGMTVDEALRAVKARRAVANPHHEYVDQIRAWLAKRTGDVKI